MNFSHPQLDSYQVPITSKQHLSAKNSPRYLLVYVNRAYFETNANRGMKIYLHFAMFLLHVIETTILSIGIAKFSLCSLKRNHSPGMGRGGGGERKRLKKNQEKTFVLFPKGLHFLSLKYRKIELWNIPIHLI